MLRELSLIADPPPTSTHPTRAFVLSLDSCCQSENDSSRCIWVRVCRAWTSTARRRALELVLLIGAAVPDDAAGLSRRQSRSRCTRSDSVLPGYAKPDGCHGPTSRDGVKCHRHPAKRPRSGPQAKGKCRRRPRRG